MSKLSINNTPAQFAAYLSLMSTPSVQLNAGEIAGQVAGWDSEIRAYLRTLSPKLAPVKVTVELVGDSFQILDDPKSRNVTSQKDNQKYFLNDKKEGMSVIQLRAAATFKIGDHISTGKMFLGDFCSIIKEGKAEYMVNFIPSTTIFEKVGTDHKLDAQGNKIPEVYVSFTAVNRLPKDEIIKLISEMGEGKDDNFNADDVDDDNTAATNATTTTGQK